MICIGYNTINEYIKFKNTFTFSQPQHRQVAPLAIRESTSMPSAYASISTSDRSSIQWTVRPPPPPLYPRRHRSSSLDESMPPPPPHTSVQLPPRRVSFVHEISPQNPQPTPHPLCAGRLGRGSHCYPRNSLNMASILATSSFFIIVF